VRLANGEPVPTLGQALSAIGSRLSVFVELKTLHPQYDARLLSLLASGPNPDGYAVHSFDHRIIQRIGRLEPKLRRGVLSGSYAVRPLAAMHDVQAQDLWQEQSLVDADLVSAVRHEHGRLIAWTVNTAARMQQLIAIGVDGLCTNYPDVARRAVDALAA
jgi:glycerophosphoryl diester phosphodiesterase